MLIRNLIFFPITTTVSEASHILFSHFLPNFSELLLCGLSQPLGTDLPCGHEGRHPPLGLRILGGEGGLPGTVSGEVGVEEDVDTHEEDGVEATDAGPESMFLGCSGVTWRGWEAGTDEGHRLPPGALASSPAVGGSERERLRVTHTPVLAPEGRS